MDLSYIVELAIENGKQKYWKGVTFRTLSTILEFSGKKRC